jgi:hypothetical protein
MKFIPSYFGRKKMSEVANCEQLSSFPILGEFPPLQKHKKVLWIVLGYGLKLASSFDGLDFLV